MQLEKHVLLILNLPVCLKASDVEPHWEAEWFQRKLQHHERFSHRCSTVVQWFGLFVQKLSAGVCVLNGFLKPKRNKSLLNVICDRKQMLHHSTTNCLMQFHVLTPQKKQKKTNKHRNQQKFGSLLLGKGNFITLNVLGPFSLPLLNFNWGCEEVFVHH